MSDTVAGKVIPKMNSKIPRISCTVLMCVCVLAILPGCERRDWQAERAQAEQQNPEVAETTELPARAASEEPAKEPTTASQSRTTTSRKVASSSNASSYRSAEETAANEAVRLEIASMDRRDNLADTTATSGSEFLIVETLWENIHPKQKVSKDKLEGKTDRTMGVGGLGAGGGSSKPVEYVEMDVAYQVPKLSNHVYLLADGQAIPLHALTASLPNGSNPEAAFGIARQGEIKELQFAFLVSKDAENVALQVFDYTNGHLFIGVKGSVDLARSGDVEPGDVLDSVSTEVVKLATHQLSFADTYGGKPAGEGWRFAVVNLGGQSVSGDGRMGRILQFDPTKYMWVNADGGYIYYASAGSTDSSGNIRFTPEFYQQQEVAFRVPAGIDRMSIGLRINRDIVNLALTRQEPRGMPKGKTSHKDGDVMEIVLYGTRKEGDLLIFDLGIKPIIEGQGLEIRTSQQFLLQTPAGELRPDANATAELAGHPPEPFVVPPGVAVRFELAYKPSSAPTAMRVRGFRSEGSFAL